MAEFRSQAEVERAISEGYAQGWSRTVIHEELERHGLTYHQAYDALDGHPIHLGDSSSKPGLVGFGGWLVFPTIGIPLNLIVSAAVLLGILSGLHASEVADLERRFPRAGVIWTLGLAAEWILFVATLVVAVLYFRTMRAARAAVVAWLALTVVLSVGLLVVAAWAIPGRILFWREAGSALVTAAIWMPYFLFSKRVKRTFVN